MSLLGQSLRINGARDESALPMIATEVLRCDAVYWQRYSCEAAGLGLAELTGSVRDHQTSTCSAMARASSLDTEVAHGALDFGVAERTRVIMHLLLTH